MKIHFIGIGGIGLSALALYLKEEGHTISGSDIKATHITKKLQNNGIKVTIPHSKESIKDQDIVIYSAAIKKSNIEYQEAIKKGIRLLSRKEALKLILKDKKVYAVAGAHGKSTTSAMLGSIIDANMLIGAESVQYGSNMRYIYADELVFEADESDESFINSNPYLAIVTNCEPEHMEYYGYDYDRFYGAYKRFLSLAKKRVINAEDPFLADLDMEAVRLYPSKDITNIECIVKEKKPYTVFELKDIGGFRVFGIGEHVALDASLAILAALEEGFNKKLIQKRLDGYKGIKKRFDILLSDKKRAIVDDYAHHPTEIEATLKSAKIYAKLMGYNKIRAIWQPHKYSRVLNNIDGFRSCFKDVDELTILPVWSAGESRVNIDFEEIFKEYKPIFADRVKREEHSLRIIKDSAEICRFEDELIIGFGAGDLTYQLRGIE